jgi:hypothetical protein
LLFRRSSRIPRSHHLRSVADAHCADFRHSRTLNLGDDAPRLRWPQLRWASPSKERAKARQHGKVGYLKWLAKNNSSAFASLLGKVLPTTLAGDPANPIRHEHEVDLTAYSDAELETTAAIQRRVELRNKART